MALLIILKLDLYGIYKYAPIFSRSLYCHRVHQHIVSTEPRPLAYLNQYHSTIDLGETAAVQEVTVG
jgi:hypothetical protein